MIANPTNAEKSMGAGGSIMFRWCVVLVASGLFAVWATWRMSQAAGGLSASSLAPAPPAVEYWTCTMDPDVRQPSPGKCPKCGMEMIPKYVGSDEPGIPPAQTSVTAAHLPTPPPAKALYRCTMPECNDPGSEDPQSRCPVCGMKREDMGTESVSTGTDENEVRLSDRAQRLAELAVEPVTFRHLFKRIRTVGTVTFDETRHKMVSAWTGGRIDKLFADYTGMVVNKGDHLLAIYSPELYSAQEELLQAKRRLDGIGQSTSSSALRSAQQVLNSARLKLIELHGLTQDQVDDLENSDRSLPTLVTHAPIGGTIVRKAVMEGMYVKTGDVLYEIADLTHLWILLDLYEADLPWIEPFQEVHITAESVPGEMFAGLIAFVDPLVDLTTRTIKVQVHVDNPQHRLKPGMFVTAQINVPAGPDGKAAPPPRPGDYACSMHPWETSDDPGKCALCGMDMVAVASIAGYKPPTEPAPVLSVPRQAVMRTGDRALVYVESTPGAYRGVEVQVGPLAQDAAGRQFYSLLSGLDEGQLVVTRGGFVIDSQMQISGKPSLFNARGLAPMPGHSHHEEPGNDPDPDVATKADSAAQILCPVMGNEIDAEVFVDFHGVKINFCCWGCDKKFAADSDKYISKLPAAMQEAIRKATAVTGGDSDG